MPPEKISVGEFKPLAPETPEVLVAELSGPSIERCVGLLSIRPPFRDRTEVQQLSPKDLDEARVLACVASGALGLVSEARGLNRQIQKVIFSRTGALALINRTPGDGTDQAIELVRELNHGEDLLVTDACQSVVL